jgi:hypothetical protein
VFCKNYGFNHDRFNHFVVSLIAVYKEIALFAANDDRVLWYLSAQDAHKCIEGILDPNDGMPFPIERKTIVEPIVDEVVISKYVMAFIWLF